MICPGCRGAIADNLLQCSSCGTNVSFVIASPEGQQFGPYSVQSLQEYVAQGRINPNSSASLGGSAWMPLTQALAWVAPPSAPAAGHPAVMPSAPTPAGPAPQPQGPPGVYRGNAAAAQRPTRKAAKKRAIPWRLVVAGAVVLVAAVVVLILRSGVGKPGRISDVQLSAPGTDGEIAGSLRVWWRGSLPAGGLSLVVKCPNNNDLVQALPAPTEQGQAVTFSLRNVFGVQSAPCYLCAGENSDVRVSNRVTVTFPSQ